ncbi:retrotransposon protein, putative, ty1-copia subclass [Tanacetum coccineum]|uniref:Retrotransposon protein, putative, ty1-copia subclass n=1 Tax=Tanacetum coccineum TaxID=301880 RepID=A0ABQ5AM54_9ASTR
MPATSSLATVCINLQEILCRSVILSASSPNEPKSRVSPLKSIQDYALETATSILNMVPTKKVDKTPYELWYGKVPNLTYLKIWGCEALVKQDTPDKLQQRSVKCIFIGYPKETIDKDTSPSKNTSEIPMEVEGFEPPQKEVFPIHRSVRTHRALDCLCLNVEVEEHSLGDLNEPNNYKVAILDPESDKWVDAMNAEMQSIKYNQVCCLVDLPPNCKIVRSKWLFKKKIDMDGIVHTYKARLVAKGFTQTYGVDYKETFSSVVDNRVIRILIAITVFYDYEIWHRDIKTVFLDGYLNEDIYIMQPEGFVDPNYLRKVCKFQRSIYGLKMDNSKRGYIPMQERLDLNKTQGASTPEEVKRMQNVPYASANPGKPHWTAVKTVLKYLRNTRDMILVYGGNPEAELRVDCYCDARF